MSTIRIANTQLSAEISPLGAELQSIQSAAGQEFLWQGDPAFWAGRSPVLFPIVGKAPDDQLEIDGQLYPMKQHGFARRSTFTLAEHSADFCRFELHATSETRAVYPFDFTLSVEYRLDGAKLRVTAEVHNRDHRPMPFGIGFHPAFAWPLPGATGPHRIVLDNGGEPALVRIKDGLIDPARLPSPFTDGSLVLAPEQFEADAMIFPEGAGAGLRYGPPDGPSLHFTWENLPNFALWTKPGAGFICLEPWHGTAAEIDASSRIEDRPDTEILGPTATSRYAFAVAFKL